MRSVEISSACPYLSILYRTWQKNEKYGEKESRGRLTDGVEALGATSHLAALIKKHVKISRGNCYKSQFLSSRNSTFAFHGPIFLPTSQPAASSGEEAHYPPSVTAPVPILPI